MRWTKFAVDVTMSLYAKVGYEVAVQGCTDETSPFPPPPIQRLLLGRRLPYVATTLTKFSNNFHLWCIRCSAPSTAPSPLIKPVRFVPSFMATLPEFKSQLASIHHLYFKASSATCRIIGSSMVAGSSGDKWKISLVSIPETGSMTYFERTLTYADLLTMVRTFVSHKLVERLN